jgi:putative redox protein
MDIEIRIGEGAKVDAILGGLVVSTDQPIGAGGDGTAPAPFVLFLASIGTCAGFYVQQFCRSRGIPTDGLRIVQRIDRDPATHLVNRVTIEIGLPADFPEKYRSAVVNAANVCAVKKALEHPPTVQTVIAGDRPPAGQPLPTR